MKYYHKIDGLRFVAILLVLLQHFAIGISRYLSPGFYGVDLFFVISGFLITTILIKPNQNTFAVNYKKFIGRRTLRIFPLYYLTVLILWLLNAPVIRDYLIYFVTYTFNYAVVMYHLDNQLLIHFWSLCIEEQFYLFWPLIVISLKYKPRSLIVVVLIIILTGYSQMVLNVFPSISPYNYWGLLTRMASLGLGSLGAVLLSQNLLPVKLFKSRLFEYFMLLLLLSSLILTYKFSSFKFSPLLGLCSLFLVIKASVYEFYSRPIERFLNNKRIMYIGTLAYGIYIFHLPISYYITLYIFDPIWHRIDFNVLGKLKILETNPWIIKFPLYSLLSFLLAALSYKYFEGPILKLKDKFF